MQNTELFQWVKLSQDVPGTSFKQGDEGVVVECLEANENTQESGYLLEMFQDGETVDVIAVPTAWTKKMEKRNNRFSRKFLRNLAGNSSIFGHRSSYSDPMGLPQSRR